MRHCPEPYLFKKWTSTLSPSITTLQIACACLDLCCEGLLILSEAFPNVETLQLMDVERVRLPFRPGIGFAWALFPSVKHLHVGVPWNFFPGNPEAPNEFLTLLTHFSTHSILPSLETLAVESNVRDTTPFVYRRANQLRTLISSSRCGGSYSSLALDASPSTLSSLVFVVDAHTADLLPFPPSVQSVRVRLPVLPVWRGPRSMSHAVDRLLFQIFNAVHDGVKTVTLDRSDIYPVGWLAGQKAMFAEKGVVLCQSNTGEHILTARCFVY